MGSRKRGAKHPVTPIVSHVENTHAQIRHDMETLERAEDVEEIRAIVFVLPELLKGHFDDEERPGGLFDELESLQPVIDSQLRFLRQEHREILQTLENLQQWFREADEVTQVAELEQRHDHIRVSTASFMRLIRHHERIETRLVAEAYYTEDGGSG
jgi:hypothetical protein